VQYLLTCLLNYTRVPFLVAVVCHNYQKNLSAFLSGLFLKFFQFPIYLRPISYKPPRHTRRCRGVAGRKQPVSNAATGRHCARRENSITSHRSSETRRDETRFRHDCGFHRADWFPTLVVLVVMLPSRGLTSGYLYTWKRNPRHVDHGISVESATAAAAVVVGHRSTIGRCGLRDGGNGEPAAGEMASPRDKGMEGWRDGGCKWNSYHRASNVFVTLNLLNSRLYLNEFHLLNYLLTYLLIHSLCYCHIPL